ncbi:putative membrane protein [Brevundimonas alba]|uniref:Putative membrane protein n=1 Tax=Brevundimonas alba TaxID=74314 RepID=A0A7X5YH69_9CAUL|nr:SdpI family protein [Brevundimonas alba]NJC39888.1 putative membrane protein [Brevundimonas alba]
MTLSATDRATVAVSLIIVATGAAIAFAGPLELMPCHFGADGQADAWAGREAIGAGIAGLGLLTGLLAGGMGLAAARAPDAARTRSLRAAQILILLTFLALTLFAGVTSVSGVTSLGAALPMAGLSAIFLAVGAVLGRVGPNPIAGVRTPWSYKSRLAWDRSNRLAGRLLFLIGLAGLALSPIAPQPLGYQLIIAAVLVAAVLSVFESWRVWRTDPDRQPF